MKGASLIIHPEELSRRWIDRMADAEIPTIALHPVGGPAAAKSLSEMLDRLSVPGYRELLDYAAERGLKIEYEMHSARYLLPESEFFAHPEWFRMNKDGERTADYNLCASCDAAVDFVAERAAALVRALYRSTDRYFFFAFKYAKNAWTATAHTSAFCAVFSHNSLDSYSFGNVNKLLKYVSNSAE